MRTNAGAGSLTPRRSRRSIWWWELTYRIGPNLWVVPLLMATAPVGRDAEDIETRHGRTIAVIDDRLQAMV